MPGALAAFRGSQAGSSWTRPTPSRRSRACLARWIIDRRNPLSWRSIVNRVWQHHFGRGLVSTPNDFGRMGALPSHPELLDWLATTFRESGGSLKQLDRLIVTSAAYRQCVGERAGLRRQGCRQPMALAAKSAATRCGIDSRRDPQARGKLDVTMGGPSVQQFTLSPGVHVTPVVDYTRYDWNSPGSCRRAVYRFVFRTLPDPFYDALDAADPRSSLRCATSRPRHCRRSSC